MVCGVPSEAPSSNRPHTQWGDRGPLRKMTWELLGPNPGPAPKGWGPGSRSTQVAIWKQIRTLFDPRAHIIFLSL